MIDTKELLKELNNTGVSVTFDLPAEEILGNDFVLDDLAALVRDAVTVYKKMVIDTIGSMPKVSEWIPVTHEIDEESGKYMLTCQLPEEGERVIVVDRWGYINIDEQCCDGYGWYLDGGGDWNDIVAWMPLPEVYQGKGNEKQRDGRHVK